MRQLPARLACRYALIGNQLSWARCAGRRPAPTQDEGPKGVGAGIGTPTYPRRPSEPFAGASV